MIILGVDPGTLVTGYGVIEINGGRLRMIDVGVIKNTSGEKMPIRLKKIHGGLCRIIDRYHPDEMAIETAFYSKNAQSALKIGQARGVLILAGVNAEVPVTEYSPREIKKSVVGNGAASKEQVRFMMKTLLRLSTVPKFFDATDALAAAVCHSHKIERPRSAFRDWKSFAEAHPERIVRR
ncbi:MAG TPA: crossover junction endodeoxyribonuclease RuvC [Bacteroidota bacterium]|nr:crossover junction endodeoxyribonuclease RuvC [Bacteroidota bacterium]